MTGSGTVPGVSVNAALSGARYGLLASYGWQRVQLEYTDSSYTPAYGTSQVLELGAIVFPSATSSIRVGFTGSFGRRSTGVTGAFEWEACNLLDQGCEFGGSPQTEDVWVRSSSRHTPDDLGVRRHWHLRLVGRDVMLVSEKRSPTCWAAAMSSPLPPIPPPAGAAPSRSSARSSRCRARLAILIPVTRKHVGWLHSVAVTTSSRAQRGSRPWVQPGSRDCGTYRGRSLVSLGMR